MRIVLAEKGVEYEAIEIDLADRPQWIYEKNSTGRVPVIEEDGWVLAGVGGDHGVPGGALSRAGAAAGGPGDRSLARLRIFRHDAFTGPYYALRRGEESAREAFDRQLERLDAMLVERPWLGGAEYGLADIAYVPWVLRARALLVVEIDSHPALAAWLDRMLERPAVAAEEGIVAAL